MKVADETKPERHFSHEQIAEGVSARFTSGKLDRVVLYPGGNEGQVNPLARTLVDGLDFAAAKTWDVVEALGEPDLVELESRSRVEYGVGAATLHFSMRNDDHVDSVVILKRKKRR